MSTATLTVASARDEFKALETSAYLDVAARAPMPDRVARELESYIQECQLYGGLKQEWLGRVESLRARYANFIGASASEIAFTKNTSEGMNTLVHGLGLKPGDNVIVCPGIEHPNNVYIWLPLKEQGVEVREVSTQEGEISVEDVRSRIDDRTRIVALSSVSFISGARAPLAQLSSICREHGTFLLVDAVQELGVMDIDVDALGIDGMAAATQKGLLGLYGSGTLYCRQSWIEKIQPTYYSRSAIDLGDAHESEVGDTEDALVKGTAAKFEVGNPNFVGLFALDASLSLLEDVGIKNIEKHVVSLADTLIKELISRGYQVNTPQHSDRHAGIVSFEHDNARKVVSQLEQGGVKVSARRTAVRASFHVYNSTDDIERLLQGIEAYTG